MDNRSEWILDAARRLTRTGSVDEMAQAYEELHGQAVRAFVEARAARLGCEGDAYVAHEAARFLAERILDDLVNVGRGGDDEVVLTAKGRRALGLPEPPRRVGTARKPGEEAYLVG